jgi:hypothetical protein
MSSLKSYPPLKVRENILFCKFLEQNKDKILQKYSTEDIKTFLKISPP